MITICLLKSDNYHYQWMSLEAYNEIVLQMSTGDHACHRVRTVEVTSSRLEDLKFHSSVRNAKGLEVKRKGFLDLVDGHQYFGEDYQPLSWFCYDGHGDCCVETA